ncbi:MAG: SPOR domain-containing protein [Bacteroides sp.]|nr:SPOR domain-containing protein [Bacteroides sp.]MCM1413439.1 SPOR domain-containing protein [Bacteroides sp.]MCM1471350.1 SPOR domain-containing protein [Bacteroides sp.]
MNSIRNLLVPIVFASFASLSALAQSNSHEMPPILKHIDSAAHHSIEGPPAILELLNPDHDVDKGKGNATPKGPVMRTVYRVQVFSDNHGTKSRNEANRLVGILRNRFPEYPCDVKYSGLYWRVYVGAFINRSEADAFTRRVKAALPSYSKEIHVVKDNMKVVL